MANTNLQEFNQWLWHEIPITKAMDIGAESYDSNGLTLRASLQANLNHKQTAFGGSISATLTVACWGLLHLLLKENSLDSTIVIMENHVHYRQPINNDIIAHAAMPSIENWARFIKMLSTKGRAKIELNAQIAGLNGAAADFTGSFVAFRN